MRSYQSAFGLMIEFTREEADALQLVRVDGHRGPVAMSAESFTKEIVRRAMESSAAPPLLRPLQGREGRCPDVQDVP